MHIMNLDRKSAPVGLIIRFFSNYLLLWRNVNNFTMRNCGLSGNFGGQPFIALWDFNWAAHMDGYFSISLVNYSFDIVSSYYLFPYICTRVHNRDNGNKSGK